jgi:hypothetical protein
MTIVEMACVPSPTAQPPTTHNEIATITRFGLDRLSGHRAQTGLRRSRSSSAPSSASRRVDRSPIGTER